MGNLSIFGLGRSSPGCRVAAQYQHNQGKECGWNEQADKGNSDSSAAK